MNNLSADTYIPVNDTVVADPPVFTDDFSADTPGEKANFWVQRNTASNWKISQLEGKQVYGTANVGEATCSWLHVFETNMDLTARLYVPAGENAQGRVGIMTRLSGTDAYILAGYDFAAKKWFVLSKNGPDYPHYEKMIWADNTLPFCHGRWHQLRVRVIDRHLQFWCDDILLLDTQQIRQITTGRAAIFCENTAVYTDHVRLELLSGQGRVEDAVLAHYVISDDYYSEGGSLFVHSDSLYLFNGMHGHLYLSFDQGSSFRPATKDEAEKYAFFVQETRTQYIRLHNGWVLKIDNYVGGQSYLSKDNGASFELAGKLFDYNAIDPGWQFYGGMNDMMKELLVRDPDGKEHYRVFYCADARATGAPDGSGRICYHWEDVYYTDDCGYTWHKCPQDSRWNSGVLHFTESRIMGCADGSLRMFSTYNETPYVHYLSSFDGGLSWQGETGIPEIRCPTSSHHYAADEDGTIYLAFVYTQKDKDRRIFPRTRFSLIRSKDGMHWEYLMDIWRRDSIPGEEPKNLYQTVDPSVTVTKDHLFVTAGWSERRGTEGPHNAQCQTILKLDKKKLRPYAAFPEAYTQPDDIVSLTLTPPGKTVYRAGEPLDLTGGLLTVHYFGQPDEILPLDAEGISIQEPSGAIRHTPIFPEPDSSLPGKKWLRITYGSFAAGFTVEVQ